MGKTRIGPKKKLIGLTKTLRGRTLIGVAITIILAIVVFFAVSQTIMLRSFARLEEQDTGQNVERALGALSDNLSSLATMTNDWAAWDDTYKFIEDANEQYIEANPTDEAFEGLRVNVMLFINSSGQIVFSKAFDLQKEQDMPVPRSLLAHIPPDSILVHHPDTESSVSGIIVLPEGPMLIVSEPILTSQGEGPIRGALVWGRYLDSIEIEKLAETTRLSLTVLQLDEPDMPSDFAAALSALSEDTRILVRPLDSGSVAGYTVLKDIYGAPSLILRADMPRGIYQQGQTTFTYFILSILAIGLVFGGLGLLLLEKSVLSRLSRLSARVRNIGKTGDLSARVSLTGHDELSSLADEINRMLEAVDKSQEAVQISESRYRLLADNLVDVIWTVDTGLRITYVSPSIEHFLGYTVDEAMKLSFDKIMTESSAELAFNNITRVLRSGKLSKVYEAQDLSSPLTLEHVRKDGSIVWAEVIISYIWDDNGRVNTIVGVTRDITERKRSEEEKKRMQTQLQLAGRLAAVGELAAGVAHELNNPLTAIKGFAEFLAERNDLDETAKHDIAAIHKEAQRSAKITRNLLSFARRHEPEKSLVSINEVLEKTLELRAHQMKVNNIELVVELQTDLPMTLADPNQLQQVFVNIIINAEQAMGEAHKKGRLVISTGKVGDIIRIAFADDGPGIPEQNLERIFDPFFTTKEVGKGTGLGLSICYGIVQAHGGRIYARSEPGKGATFVVEIPIVSESQVLAELAAPLQAKGDRNG